MRLAVMFAMQPDANFSRALAMSGFGVSTATPTASTADDVGRHDRQHDVEIVNHQVEDDVDVEAAIRKRAQPVHLDEPRMIEQRPDGRDRRVVALRVADAEHGAGRGGRINHLLRFARHPARAASPPARRSALQERQRHAQVRLGRNGDGHRIDPAEHFGRIGHPRRVDEAANLSRARFVDVDDRRQLDVGQRRENPRVMLPQRAYADHRDTCFHVFACLDAETQRRREFFSKKIFSAPLAALR